MELELNRLDRRYAQLRVQVPGRHARLTASLAGAGQQAPVLVVAGSCDGFVLVDGYARVAALEELGRDVVDAVVLDMEEPQALILSHRLDARRRRSAMEEAWMVRELVERHGLSQRDVAGRLQRSVSWVSRRLSLVQVLPESVQQAVREGLIPAHAAGKYLVPLARANAEQCERVVSGLQGEALTDRQVERLYLGWRGADEVRRERVVDAPRLYLKADAAAQPEPSIAKGDPAAPLLSDLAGIVGICLRVRRRVRQGVLDELDTGRRSLLHKALSEARLGFESTHSRLIEELSCSTETHAQPS